jgi:hypothetical protein
VRIMTSSPPRPPYLKAACGAANDSGLDLPLERESPILGSSNIGDSEPTGINVEGEETVSPVNPEDEASPANHNATLSEPYPF